ncbi:ABC transporter substrate-binding protein [Pseudidiomarina terrestris]|uniref:ABC transporter substrate-binding protein n=1 Tax=Pseudidiomarina terrestris TaxID=2820060 RepID=A0AAW7QVK8_9GAMM|nr:MULTISPECIES: ABC transporter substrate-binding protein [unclassified Pseudidiomarina]MDN7124237.1 ABC transporter substrate-binding protein [Pseudidiomarina sp. 1APP75-32.1]MDN7127304.1 ABC transporter substrate-binding protein [Pseudidiomarina sp. 1APR75-33.1]MDN7135258.1 ABC transporter substrate-binding protein [Pseudidiomarina sp. 1ASP75-5]MEA3586972.1 ABC transporter substrate-binding protein [Pseudidiomarina sp. 1APP75-27a]
MLKKTLYFMLFIALLQLVLVSRVQAQQTSAEPQTVFFYAWGGSESVNDYLRWAQTQLKTRHGIELQHVKVADIAEAVTILLAEGEQQTSNIDLLWINGENFKVLKDAGKLLPDLPERVPNSALLRDDLNWQTDFGVAVDGQELPWGIAQFQLIFRAPLLADHTLTNRVAVEDLFALAKRHPGRLSYPKPPAFHGTTWLKALAYELVHAPELLQQPPHKVNIAQVLQPLWDYLDQLHPYLWRQGREFPGSAEQQRQLFNHGTLDNAVTFNPNKIPALQQQLRLIPAATAVSLGSSALTNFHYLAIPRASDNRAAALTVINFMLSEAAQQRKAELNGWGDPMVIRAPTSAKPRLHAPLFPSHPEPHVEWTAVLEQEWLRRYQR